ncbi:MAG TPA: hypothetical protein VK564_00250 [Thermodesulfobacteriota bacterium]|nr:hypothetical protein [Thermodesulfobacteriota bacterium]
MSTDKEAYEPNGKIQVHFSGAPGHNSDWITIVPAKSKDDTVGDYDYTPHGQSQGTLTFNAPPSPGEYEARAYYNYRQKGYVVSARHAFMVGSKPPPQPITPEPPKKNHSRPPLLAEPKVLSDKEAYEPNEKIRVFFSGAPGSNGDWITIVSDKAKDDTTGDNAYIPDGQSQGILTFKAPPVPGEYEIRAFYNYRQKGYVVSARHAFVVSGKLSRVEPPQTTTPEPPKKIQSRPPSLAEPKVLTDKEAYEPNEKIRVFFSGAPGSNGDWITIVSDKAKDDTAGTNNYIPDGQSQGILTFKAPSSPGEYEVRAYYNYRQKGYVVSARHDFVVIGEPPSQSEPPKKRKPRTPPPSPPASPQIQDGFGPK